MNGFVEYDIDDDSDQNIEQKFSYSDFPKTILTENECLNKNSIIEQKKYFNFYEKPNIIIKKKYMSEEEYKEYIVKQTINNRNYLAKIRQDKEKHEEFLIKSRERSKKHREKIKSDKNKYELSLLERRRKKAEKILSKDPSYVYKPKPNYNIDNKDRPKTKEGNKRIFNRYIKKINEFTGKEEYELKLKRKRDDELHEEDEKIDDEIAKRDLSKLKYINPFNINKTKISKQKRLNERYRENINYKSYVAYNI